MSIKTNRATFGEVDAKSTSFLTMQPAKPKGFLDYRSQYSLTQQEKLKRHLIFKYLIKLLRGLRVDRLDEFSVNIIEDLPNLIKTKNFSDFDLEEIYELGLCFIPSYVENILICRELEKLFNDLSICGCFYKKDDLWRLDVDSRLARNGLLLPVRNRKNGYIEYLNVYRYADDKRPFRLQLRGGLNG